MVQTDTSETTEQRIPAEKEKQKQKTGGKTRAT